MSQAALATPTASAILSILRGRKLFPFSILLDHSLAWCRPAPRAAPVSCPAHGAFAAVCHPANPVQHFDVVVLAFEHPVRVFHGTIEGYRAL